MNRINILTTILLTVVLAACGGSSGGGGGGGNSGGGDNGGGGQSPEAQFNASTFASGTTGHTLSPDGASCVQFSGDSSVTISDLDDDDPTTDPLVSGACPGNWAGYCEPTSFFNGTNPNIEAAYVFVSANPTDAGLLALALTCGLADAEIIGLGGVDPGDGSGGPGIGLPNDAAPVNSFADLAGAYRFEYDEVEGTDVWYAIIDNTGFVTEYDYENDDFSSFPEDCYEEDYDYQLTSLGGNTYQIETGSISVEIFENSSALYYVSNDQVLDIWEKTSVTPAEILNNLCL